jgi:hypothetical protein
MTRRALLVLVALALSGCANAGDGLGALRGGNASRTDYVRDFHDALTPQYNRTFSFPVEAGARVVNVSAGLITKSGGVLPAQGTPASITVTLLDPAGAPRAKADLDAAHPNGTALAAAPLAAGTWHVQVVGTGGNLDAQAVDVSTSYALRVGVAYS